MKTTDFVVKRVQSEARQEPVQQPAQQERTLAEFCAESAEQLYSSILSEGAYQGTHYEVNYIDKDGKDRFTVVTAKSNDDAKEKFKAKHKGSYKKITSLRSTGHDVMKEGEGDAVKAAFEEGYEFALSSKGKGYSNPYSPDTQSSQCQAYKQGFLKGRTEVSQRIVSKQDEVAEGIFGQSKQEKLKAEFEARRAARKAREAQPKGYNWDDTHYDVAPKRGVIEEHTSKLGADYSDHSTSANKCSNCSMFRAPNSCTKVEGMINPNGICKFYSPRNVNEDASAGGTGAGAVATVVGGVGKPGTGKPKKVGNVIRRSKPQFGKGIY